MPDIPAIINTGNRIIIAVGKKVFVVQVLFCFQNIGRICVDKAAGLRVIVAVLQVIQPCVRIKIVPTIAEGVQVANIILTGDLLPVSVLHRQRIAPAVIDIPRTQGDIGRASRRESFLRRGGRREVLLILIDFFSGKEHFRSL